MLPPDSGPDHHLDASCPEGNCRSSFSLDLSGVALVLTVGANLLTGLLNL